MTTGWPAPYLSLSLFCTHRRRYLVLLLLLTLLANAASAQQPSPPPPGSHPAASTPNQKAPLTGGATADTGQPFANIVVYVSLLGGTSEQQREVATDEAGNFQVDGLAPAGYSVECIAE